MSELATSNDQPTSGRKLRRLGISAGVIATNSFNSASNFLLVVLLARALDVAAFGTISVVLTGLLLCVVFIRGLIIEPMIASPGPVAPRAALPHVAISSGLIGSAALAGALALGFSLAVAIGLGLGAGSTIALDNFRFILIKQSRHVRAAAIDALWLMAQIFAAMAVSTSAPATAVAWGLGGILAVLLAAFSMAPSPKELSIQAFKMRFSWGLEHVVAASGTQLALLAVPLVAGFPATGSLRGAASLLGFTTVLMGAMHQLGLIRLAAVVDNPRKVAALAIRLSMGVAALVLLSVLPFLMISDTIGVHLLGETWRGSRAVLPWFIVQKVLVVFTFGAVLVTRVLDLSSGLIRDRSILAVATVIAALVGGATMGARGAAIGIDFVALITFGWWVRRIARNLPANSPPPTTTSTSG